MEEGPVGAAIHNNFLEPREGLRGDALEASLALQKAILAGTLNDFIYETVFVHYVIPAPVREKLRALEVSRATYYSTINRAHNRLEPHLP